MHYLIENGAIKTKDQVEKEREKSIQKTIAMFGVTDNRSKK